MSEQSHSSTVTCPGCGGPNTAEAIFCANPACHKALGGFKYVLEEVSNDTSWIMRWADRVNELTGQPHFVSIHIIWFALWILLNAGIFTGMAVFDPYPYGLLGIILAIEATLITSFLLISNNRQNTYANKRAELDYEVNVRTFRIISRVESELAHLSNRLDKIEEKLAR
ncbi:MAG: DUF1003 domain-containing protein [Bdellovibrionota bacterium]